MSIRQSESIPASLMGSLWPDPQPLPAFQLNDQQGQVFGLDQLRGHWSLIFFGYASCPDICPTTMMTLASMVSELKKSGRAVPQVILVSVDPDRDDAATLGEYVRYFNADFIALRGEEDLVHAFTLNMGAMYSREPAVENGSYEVAHSASVFLVDPQARKYGMFSPPLIPRLMADNLVQIQQYYEHSRIDTR